VQETNSFWESIRVDRLWRAFPFWVARGSPSFEMVRTLVERLPVMVTPRWVASEAQPIAVSDLLDYLIAAMDLPIEGSKAYEIGGGVDGKEVAQRYCCTPILPAAILRL
jgi:uncharacterized protein YbjT (DUF2867 family)